MDMTIPRSEPLARTASEAVLALVTRTSVQTPLPNGVRMTRADVARDLMVQLTILDAQGPDDSDAYTIDVFHAGKPVACARWTCRAGTGVELLALEDGPWLPALLEWAGEQA